MPRLQAQDALEERLRLDGRFQHREAVVEVRLGRDLGQQGLDLRGEKEAGTVPRVEERLLTQAVPSEEEAVPVPDGEGEHADEALEAARPPLSVGIDDHFGVAAGREPVASAFELLSQLDVVEELSVTGDPEAAAPAGQGLVAALPVDDGQPPDPELHRRVPENALIVRAAVGQQPRHGRDVAAAVDAGDPAHQLFVRGGARMRNSQSAHGRSASARRANQKGDRMNDRPARRSENTTGSWWTRKPLLTALTTMKCCG